MSNMSTHLTFSASVPVKWESREEGYKATLKPGGVGAEIGVYNGDNSANLSRLCSPSKMYLIDKWMVKGMPKDKLDDHLARKQNVMDSFCETGLAEVLDMSSEDASYEIEDKTLDWVFIDGNHCYPMALFDLQLYLPKVKVGGIVMLHDFTVKIARGGVIEAVWYQMKKYNDMKVLGKTSEKNPKLLKQPTIFLKKISHNQIYTKWW